MSADDAARAEPRRSFRLVLALMRKEALQIRRDPSSISIAFVLPLVLLLLFGYGVSLDADHVRLAMVVETPTAETQALVASFANSPYFEVERRLHRGDAEAELEAGRVKGVVVLASDFSRELARADGAPIQLMLDGTDANTARLVRGYVDGVWASWLQQRALEQRQPLVVPLLAEPRVWFNPQLRSRYFLIPGLIGIIMALIGTLLTALVVAREWERGTMESLLSTPATGWQVLAGKLVPYFVLGLGAMALSVILGTTVFGVPFRGSVMALLLISTLFLVGALALGLLISAVSRNQFVAGQIAIVSAFLPAFMLSGFVFQIDSMPLPIRLLTYVFPARYLVSALQTLFLVGDIWAVLWPNLAGLAVIAAVLLLITARHLPRRLD